MSRMYDIKADIKNMLAILDNLREQAQSGDVKSIVIITQTRDGDIAVGARGHNVELLGMLEIAKWDILEPQKSA